MFRKSLRVEHQFVTAYSAWANGVVERANRELVRTLRGLLAETNQRPEMWHTVAPLAQAIINNTPSHSRLNGLTPHEVMFGSPATQPLDTVLGEHPSTGTGNAIQFEPSVALRRHCNQLAETLGESWTAVSESRTRRSRQNALARERELKLVTLTSVTSSLCTQ